MEGRIRVVVSFDDTDCSKRVHFSRYSIWIDRAIQEYFRGLGFEFQQDGSLRFGETGEVVAFAIGEYRARMDRPSKLGDVLDVVARPAEIRSRVIVFDGSVSDASDGATVASGRITMIHLDPSTGRSRDIPGWLAALVRR